MSRTALIVVDVQNDFTEGGSLAVPGGAEVAQAISEFIAGDPSSYDLIIASKDYHIPNDSNGGHIAIPPDEPNYKNLWPAHCVQGTEGAEYNKNLVFPSTVYPWHVEKGQGKPAYSVFDAVSTFNNDAGVPETTMSLLQEYEITDLHICGLALDYCVLQTATDKLAYKFKTRTVLLDLTAAVAESTAIFAKRSMSAASVNLLYSTEL